MSMAKSNSVYMTKPIAARVLQNTWSYSNIAISESFFQIIAFSLLDTNVDLTTIRF